MSQQPPVSTPAAPELPAHQPGTPPGIQEQGFQQPGQHKPASSFDIRPFWAGAGVAVASYAATFIFGLAALVFALAGAAASQGDQLPAIGGTAATEQAPDAWSQLGQLAAQLVAMAHLGSAGTAVEGAAPFFGSVRGEGQVYAVPLTVLLVGMASI